MQYYKVGLQRLSFVWALYCINLTAHGVEFDASQIALIQSLTLTKPNTIIQQKNAEPSNRYSQNIEAKKLGKALFFDTRLSGSGTVSCANCHNFSTGLTDNKTLAQGLGKGSRNTPTLINVFMQRWFYWDGRADSLWLQAIGPIESPLEMGGDWAAIYQLFKNDKKLFNSYNQLFTLNPINKNKAFTQIDTHRFKTNIAKALAAFQIDITQFNSPFDAFAQSIRHQKKTQILTLDQQQGLKIFIGKGRCITCHSGPNFSDGEFHNIRLKSQLTNPNDSGRYGAITALKNNPMNILGLYSDLAEDDINNRSKTYYLTAPNKGHNTVWAAFKTPTLRNVAQTAPYMHDGSMQTLKAVINHYSTFKNAAPNTHANNNLLQPLNLSPKEQTQLIAFLHSLTGTVKIPNYE